MVEANAPFTCFAATIAGTRTHYNFVSLQPGRVPFFTIGSARIGAITIPFFFDLLAALPYLIVARNEPHREHCCDANDRELKTDTHICFLSAHVSRLKPTMEFVYSSVDMNLPVHIAQLHTRKGASHQLHRL
jgi:hypothetical protein